MAEPEREPGRLVRETWVTWAKRQPDPKPSWLVPWEDLSEDQRKVDAEIEAAVRADELERFRRFSRAFADGGDETTMAALYDEAMATGARAERDRCVAEIFAYADEHLAPLIGVVYRDAARLLLREAP
jgi:hypothetical protein